jgi:hypothetical protein
MAYEDFIKELQAGVIAGTTYITDPGDIGEESAIQYRRRALLAPTSFDIKSLQAKYPEEYAEHFRRLAEANKPGWGEYMLYTMGAIAAVVTGGALTGIIPTTAVGGEVVVGAEALFVGGEFVAYDAALAAGAAEGVGVAATGSTIATGAEVVAGGGLFSSISSGLKSTSEVIGLSGLFKGVLETGGAKISSLIDREVSSLFGGEEGKPGMPGQAGTSGGMGSFLPYILIGITLLGAFILSRKKRR